MRSFLARWKTESQCPTANQKTTIAKIATLAIIALSLNALFSRLQRLVCVVDLVGDCVCDIYASSTWSSANASKCGLRIHVHRARFGLAFHVESLTEQRIIRAIVA
jgi:hypothetical protein